MRQLAQWTSGTFKELPRWRYEDHPTEAPGNITTFTDGGLEFGDAHWMGFGTWGLWTEETNAVCHNLEGLAAIHQVGEGTGCHGETLAPAMSSTRQEAIALYAGISLQKPQTFGIDNQAVVTRFNKLLKQKGKVKKPTGLQEDGDVWEAIATAVRKKRG